MFETPAFPLAWRRATLALLVALSGLATVPARADGCPAGDGPPMAEGGGDGPRGPGMGPGAGMRPPHGGAMAATAMGQPGRPGPGGPMSADASMTAGGPMPGGPLGPMPGGALTVGLAAGMMPPPGAPMRAAGGMPPGPGGVLSDRSLDALGATPEQKARIHDILGAAHDEMRRQREGSGDLHRQLMRLLAAPKLDAEAVEAQRKKLEAQHDQTSKRFTRALIEAGAVLSTEQRQKLSERIARQQAWHDLLERQRREREALESAGERPAS